jgi:hypothetical protein
MAGRAMSRVASMGGLVHPEGAPKPPHSFPQSVDGPLQREAAYWVVSMVHHTFSSHFSPHFLHVSSLPRIQSHVLHHLSSPLGRLCLLAVDFFAEKPTDGRKRDGF